jgi:hypothetical protein
MQELVTQMDRRLVKTLMDLLLVIVVHRHRNQGLLESELAGVLLGGGHAPAGDNYARPSTTPRTRNPKNTLCAEWTMMAIQVLRKRQLGNARTKAPLITFPTIPQGW